MQFTADNPGSWAYHCHNLYHAADGMFRLVRYVGTDLDGDGLPDGNDFDPAGAWPVTWIDDLGGAFAPGTTFEFRAQWLPGELVLLLAGAKLPTPISLGPKGTLALPNDSSLTGLDIGLQAIGSHSTLSPGYRLSTMTSLTRP